MSALREAALNAMGGCLAVRKGESVLVICDEPEREIGAALMEAACDLGAEAMLLEILPRSYNGEEPPPAVAEIMKRVDVLACPTSRSLTHTEARRAASEAGVRTATLPGITVDCMLRTLNADYEKISRRSQKVAAALSAGQRVRVESPAGTSIEFSIEGRAGHADTGIIHNPGDVSNLPAGEGYIAPLEGTAEGVIVFQAAVAGLGKLEDETIRLEVRAGYVEKVKGGKAARELRRILEPHGREAYNLAELGVGTNDRAIVTGMILEDEKVFGTVHLALGDNRSMGGRVAVQSHIDGLVLAPTLWIDGKPLLRDGKLL